LFFFLLKKKKPLKCIVEEKMATGAFTTRSAIWLAIGCFIAIVTSGWAKTYDRCELAHDLQYKYKFPADQISQCMFYVTMVD